MMNQPSLRGLVVGVVLLSFMVESISAFSSSTVAWRVHVTLHLRSSSTTRTALTLRVDEDDDFPDPHALMEYLDGPSELDGDGTGGTGEFLSFQDFQELQRKQQYLRSCPIFRDCSEGDLSRIAKSMVLQEVSPGEHLVKQGETGASAMYFLKSGSLQAVGQKPPATTKDGNDNDNGKKDQQGAQEEPETVIYTTYSKEGSFFGELALLFGQPRAASIVAVDGSAVYRLDKEAFATSIVDSPVYDTAKRMILAKYKSKRLRDILPKIRLDELLGLVKARLMTPKIRSIRAWLLTLRSYSLGACATLLAMKYVQAEALKPVVIVAMGVLAHVL